MWYQRHRLRAPGEGDGDEGGGGGGDWRDALPESVRGWQEAQTATTPEAFFDQLGNMRSLVGRSVQIPSPDAGAEDLAKFISKAVEASNGRLAVRPGDNADETELAAFRTAMGVPEDLNAYELPEVEGIPEGYIADARLAALREVASKAGLTPQQFQAMADGYLTLDAAELKANQEHIQANSDALKREWGEAYEDRFSQLEQWYERNEAPPDVLAAIKDKSVSPDVAKWFYAMMERTGTPPSITHQKPGSPSMTPDEAYTRLAEIDRNPDHPRNDPSHPGHARALEDYVKLVAASMQGQEPSSEDEMRASMANHQLQVLGS